MNGRGKRERVGRDEQVRENESVSRERERENGRERG